MTIKVTMVDGILFMDVPGQTNYETIARGDHHFKLKILDGYGMRFEVDNATGKTTAMYLLQPNGTFKADRVN